MSDRIADFLQELAKLTDKYGIEVGGCGCCGSPWLEDTKNRDNLGDELTYDSKTKTYNVHLL